MENIHAVESFENLKSCFPCDIDQEIKGWYERYTEAQEIIEEWEELEERGEVYGRNELCSDYSCATSQLKNCRELLPEERDNIFAYIKHKLEQNINVYFDELVPAINRYVFCCVNHLLEKVNAKNVFEFHDKYLKLRNEMEEQTQNVDVEVLDEELYPVTTIDEQQLENIQNDVDFLYEQVIRLQREHELSKRNLPKAADNRALYYLNEEKIKLPEPVKKKDIDLEKTLAYSYKEFYNRKQKTINYAAVNNYILFEKIEFYLFNSFSNDTELNKWLPGDRKGDEWIISNGIAINTKKPYGSNDFISYFVPCRNDGCMNNCPAKTCRNISCTGPENSSPRCCLLHKNNEYLSCYQATTSYTIPTWDDLSRLHKLIALYKSINGIDWEEAIEDLAHDFDIDMNNSLIYRKDQKNIEKNIKLSKSKMHSFFIKDSYLLPNTQPPVMYINFGRSKGSEKLLLIGTEEALLPVSNYIRTKDIAHSTFNFLSQGKLPLLNLKFFIEEYSHYPVLLTSDLHFANDHALDLLKQNAIVTSWYGKKFTCENIDFKPLEGRQLYYLYDEDSEEETAILIKLFDLFFGKRKIKLEVLKQDPEGNTEALTIVEFLEFVEEKWKGKYITEKLKGLSDEIDTFPTKKIDPKFIISPIIAEKDLVILFAPSDYGKTWLAEAIAVAVSEGKEVFSQWQVTKPRKTLLIVGEMDKQSHSNRFFDLNRIYAREKKGGKKMLISKREDINLLDETGQHFVENLLVGYKGIELIIFDNLVTLAPGATFEDKWDDLRKWFKSLKVTVVLLHHTNKQGEYRGSSDIKGKSDFMIFGRKKEQIINSILQKVKKERGVNKLNFSDVEKIFDSKYPEPPGDNNLTWYIDYEKKRNVKEKDAQMFRAVFNFDEHSKSSTSIDIDNDIIPLIIEKHQNESKPTKIIYPKNNFKNWDEKFKQARIKELLAEGYSNAEMADKLSVSKTTIKNIKRSLKTSSDSDEKND